MLTTLVPCSECGCHVQSRETTCPHCDAPVGKRRPTRAALFASLSTAALLGGACSDDAEGPAPNPTPSSTSTGLNAGGAYGVGPGVGPGGFGGEGGSTTTGLNAGGAYGVGPGGFGGSGGTAGDGGTGG